MNQAAERAVARLLNGRRCHFEGQDVDAGRWAVEVKHGRQVPRTLLKWFEQARQSAGEGKTPLLVLHPHGASYEDSLAVLRLADLIELLSQVSAVAERAANETSNQIRATSTPDDSVSEARTRIRAASAPAGPANDGPQPQNNGERGPLLPERGAQPPLSRSVKAVRGGEWFSRRRSTVSRLRGGGDD